MKISVARPQEPKADTRAVRVLIARQWPAGLSRSQLALDAWLRDAAPSPGLEEWFKRAPDDWDTFRDRYFRELDTKPTVVSKLIKLIGKSNSVLISTSAHESYRSVIVLRDYLSMRPEVRSQLTTTTANPEARKAS